MTSTTALTPVTPYSTAASNASLVSGQGSTDNGKNIDAVSKDFEAVFLTQMMGAMFEGDDFNAYFGGGVSGDVYKSYLLNELGKNVAQAGGIGIAASVKSELLKLQEAA
jgi:flagellar protein FlgJ